MDEYVAPENNGLDASKGEYALQLTLFADAVDKFNERFASIQKLCTTFVDDLTWVRDAVKAVGATESARRIFVRTSYSNAEGFLWVAKQMLANTNQKEFTPELTDGEILFLNDKELKIDPNTGATTEVKAKVTLKDNIKETKRIMRRVKGCETFDLDLGSTQGQSFFVGVRVRDRLTHPKSAEQMMVSDDEMLAVQDGVGWLTNGIKSFISLFESSRKADMDKWFSDVLAEARQHGVDDATIDAFVKRVRPSYTPPKDA